MPESDPPESGADRTMPEIVTIKDVYREVMKLNGNVIRFEATAESIKKDSLRAQATADQALNQIVTLQISLASFKSQWSVITAIIAAAVPVILKLLKVV